ncbi:MAG: MFS transporter [Alteromonadaceae bacterium]|nr:MAG: MFS transporter [Alteromonadaceae bacterium]
MTSEARSVASLALLYAIRMLGLFMVLPVLVIYGGDYRGATPLLLGAALGVYGLTQALFQIPLGMLSDIFGRKPIIFLGLMIFACGSLLAASAESIEGLILGRALQGSGAIASAVMAMLADLTSEQNRTKAMAAIGASIGLSFSVAMIIGPMITAVFGLSGVFVLSAILAGVGVGVLYLLVPSPPQSFKRRDTRPIPQLIRETAANVELLRLNWGIFSLHAILMASFVAVPYMLEQDLGIERAQHWQVYLPVLLFAFIAMLPFMMVAERKQKIKPVFLLAVFMLAVTLFALSVFHQNAFAAFAAIFLFFVAFNLLEATLPSLVSKISPAGSKGTAMGIYSTSQFLGAFVGGLVGGWFMGQFGVSAVFLASAIAAGLWFLVAFGMRKPKHLSSLCVPVVTGFSSLESVRSLAGIEDAMYAEEESLLYLKIDKRTLDEGELNALTGIA